MDKEKEIEEMAMGIAECNGTSCDNCALKCRAYITCEILQEKGYGNIKQAKIEILEKLESIIHQYSYNEVYDDLISFSYVQKLIKELINSET